MHTDNSRTLSAPRAARRAQQRGIPPLAEQWLDEYGEEDYDGHGAIRRYFSYQSVKALERAVGRDPVRRLSHYLDAYKVEALDGKTITVGWKDRRLWRR